MPDRFSSRSRPRGIPSPPPSRPMPSRPAPRPSERPGSGPSRPNLPPPPPRRPGSFVQGNVPRALMGTSGGAPQAIYDRRPVPMPGASERGTNSGVMLPFNRPGQMQQYNNAGIDPQTLPPYFQSGPSRMPWANSPAELGRQTAKIQADSRARLFSRLTPEALSAVRSVPMYTPVGGNLGGPGSYPGGGGLSWAGQRVETGPAALWPSAPQYRQQVAQHEYGHQLNWAMNQGNTEPIQQFYAEALQTSIPGLNAAEWTPEEFYAQMHTLPPYMIPSNLRKYFPQYRQSVYGP